MGAPAGLVIATGGGAVVNPANREALAAGGTVICLEAEPKPSWHGWRAATIGPCWPAPIACGASLTCWPPRAEAYAALPDHLDTTHLTIAAAAERVMGIAAGLPEGGHRLPVT